MIALEDLLISFSKKDTRMEFDFYEQYKNYPTVELLKIVQQQDNYQADAINAANKSLAERTIADIELAKEYLESIAAAKNKEEENARLYKEKAIDLLEPIIKPRSELNPYKWFWILLLVISIQYGYSFYKSTVYIIKFIQCNGCEFNEALAFRILDFVYAPFLLALLFRRKKLGWILFYINNLFIFIYNVYSAPIFFKYRSIHHGNIYSFLLLSFWTGFLVYFMAQRRIISLYSITPFTKKAVIIITVIVGTTMYLSTGHPFTF